MQQLTGKVAVVTGAGSGIGLGMARAFAAAKMRLVLADIESGALASAATELQAAGADVVTVSTDVADPEAVAALAERAWSAFGAVNVLCNNAGVIENNRPTWEYSLEDWNWVLGINLMGVVHGIRAFVPRMLDDGEAGHIVNTASFGGLISGSATPIYIASKHAVVALSENLYHDFASRGAPIGVSALCPGWVRTAIVESDRNRADAPALDEKLARTRQRFQQGIDSGIEPDTVGGMVVDAITTGRFYIHTHPEWLDVVRERCDAVIEGTRPPRSLIPNPKR